jgi:hypothetical protein
MSLEAEFRREADQAMHDDDRLLAAMRSLLERAWDFVREPGSDRYEDPEPARA